MGLLVIGYGPKGVHVRVSWFHKVALRGNRVAIGAIGLPYGTIAVHRGLIEWPKWPCVAHIVSKKNP